MLRKLMVRSVVVGALTLGSVGVGSAHADPTNFNDACKDPDVQELIAQIFDVPANHGQCRNNLRGPLVEALCADPDVRPITTAVLGVRDNFGQCKKGLENFAPAPT